MSGSRDPQAHAAAATAGARVLSVPEAVEFIDEHFATHIDGITTHPLISERHVRRLISSGHWPCTRTAEGHLGITASDIEAIWTGGRQP